MSKIKCITFDKNAQKNLSKEIRERMKEDRKKAEKEQCNIADDMRRCVKTLRMQNGDKEIAFIEGKHYKEVTNGLDAIELINEQGYVHKITGNCLTYFNAPQR